MKFDTDVQNFTFNIREFTIRVQGQNRRTEKSSNRNSLTVVSYITLCTWPHRRTNDPDNLHQISQSNTDTGLREVILA